MFCSVYYIILSFKKKYENNKKTVDALNDCPVHQFGLSKEEGLKEIKNELTIIVETKEKNEKILVKQIYYITTSL